MPWFAEQQPSSEEAGLTYANIRAALEAVKPGGAKQRTQAKHLLALRHEQAVALLGEDKLDLQVYTKLLIFCMLSLWIAKFMERQFSASPL